MSDRISKSNGGIYFSEIRDNYNSKYRIDLEADAEIRMNFFKNLKTINPSGNISTIPLQDISLNDHFNEHIFDNERIYEFSNHQFVSGVNYSEINRGGLSNDNKDTYLDQYIEETRKGEDGLDSIPEYYDLLLSESDIMNNITIDDSSKFQVWTVPETSEYKIKAVGAPGGFSSRYGNFDTLGGYNGASIEGNINLNIGDKLLILCGKPGLNADVLGNILAEYPHSAGGGGGTFVLKIAATYYNTETVDYLENTLLIAAGGGGGSCIKDKIMDTKIASASKFINAYGSDQEKGNIGLQITNLTSNDTQPANPPILTNINANTNLVFEDDKILNIYSSNQITDTGLYAGYGNGGAGYSTSPLINFDPINELTIMPQTKTTIINHLTNTYVDNPVELMSGVDPAYGGLGLGLSGGYGGWGGGGGAISYIRPSYTEYDFLGFPIIIDPVFSLCAGGGGGYNGGSGACTPLFTGSIESADENTIENIGCQAGGGGSYILSSEFTNINTNSGFSRRNIKDTGGFVEITKITQTSSILI